MVRSRFSAFALKDINYLWRTLHPAHPDRARPQAEVLADLRESSSTVRYRGLQIIEERPAPSPDEPSQVLFLARIFVKGVDRSFIELSDFLPDEGEAWGYAGGVGVSASGVPLKGLTIERFLGLLPADR
jgi:SEC-C motif-containing protein